jgi:hypothetical protein
MGPDRRLAPAGKGTCKMIGRLFYLSLACASGAILPTVFFEGKSAAAGVTEYRFEVFLNDSKVGHQTFTLTEQGEQKVIEIRADLKVKILFVPVYSYHHENVEVWEDNCLRRMSSKTDDNGSPFAVQGVAVGDSFEVTTARGTNALPGCVMSFAYWDKGFLKQPKLLNPQTGEYVAIAVTDLADDRVSVAGRDFPAHCHLLAAENSKIKLCYSQDGDWLALESMRPDGGILRYVRANAPAQAISGGI